MDSIFCNTAQTNYIPNINVGNLATDTLTVETINAQVGNIDSIILGNPTGGIKVPLSDYEIGTLNWTIQGFSGSVTQGVTLSYTRVGNTVSLNFPEFVTVAGANFGLLFSVGNVLPTRLRPLSNTSWPIIVINTGGFPPFPPIGDKIGNFIITSSGAFQIYYLFTIDVNVGYREFSVTYTLS